MIDILRKLIFVIVILPLHCNIQSMNPMSMSTPPTTYADNIAEGCDVSCAPDFVDVLEGISPYNSNDSSSHNNDPSQHTDFSMAQTLAVLIDRTNDNACETEQPTNSQSVEAESIERSTSHTESHEFQSSHEFYTEMARDNALDAHKEGAKLAAAEASAEQDYQHRTGHEPQQNRAPVSSEPGYPLTDAIDKLDSKLESPQGRHALEHRLAQIRYQQSGFQVFTNAELDKEATFIHMALNGTVTKLLNDIQHGDVHIAQSAYRQLRDAWPYEHTGSFLAPREISGAENRLMGLMGGDLMQKAERCLVSRPDYIRAHGDRIYREIAVSQKEYEQWADQGKIQQLKEAEHRFANALKNERNRGDIRIKARLVILHEIMSDPVVKSYAVITYGSLKQAKQEMRYIEQQVFEHFAKQGITDPFEINALLPESVYYEPLTNMQRLLEARPDFQQEQFEVEHITHLYPEAALSEAITENRDLLDVYRAHSFGNSERVEARLAILDQISHNNIKLSHETYTLTDNAVSLLSKEGIDHKPYLTCSGNQLQQLNHRDCVGIVEQLALPNQDVLVREYMSSMLHLVEAAREYNHANAPIEAMCISDICWTIFDCGKAACEGIIDGTIGSIMNNPIETLACAIAPYHVLAYQLGKVAVNLADIGITGLMDPKLGEQKLFDYIKPLTDCIDAISKKEFKLRDGVKITACVATQVVAQGKLYAGLRTFYDTAKKRAKAYAKGNPAATAQEFFATPGGMMFKATGGPGKNGPSLKDMGGNGPKGSGLNKSNIPTISKDSGSTAKPTWERYRSKHKPAKNVSWKETVKSTIATPAKYKPEINIQKLELHAWEHGTLVNNGKNYKVFKCDDIIGATRGKETQYIRVECSANTIHGHPISEEEYFRYIR